MSSNKPNVILRKRPQKSIRTILMMWLLMFAVVPLAFITGYSLVKYEQSIDQELLQRLVGNNREIQVILQEFQKELNIRNSRHANDKSLIYYLSSNSISAARELAFKWMKGHFTHRLSIFNREGRLEVALYRKSNGDVERLSRLEGADVYLSDQVRESAPNDRPIAIIEFTKEGALDLIMFSKVFSAKGKVVGYIEEILRLDQNFISSIKNRLNIEIAFISNKGDKVVTSHEDLSGYREGFFISKHEGAPNQFFELNIRDVPYGFIVQPAKWGKENFFIAIGASKRAAKEVLKNVNFAFFTVVGAIVLLLVALSFIFSRIMLQPLNNLVEFVQNLDFSHPPEKVDYQSNNEIGILTSSFNDMANRVYEAQAELRDNIKKLEDANNEIRETQARLVHTAKMASLGQLVAGVAHELNNPIGFIYSNMEHLREYSDKLINLVKDIEKNPNQIAEQKEKIEFDYIIKDMPKLIQSCEDGARRTRDIVLGLRSFSRLEEAKLKEVDIHEGLDSTLSLLSGELKDRIKIVKNYKLKQKIHCYPSQLNQVFMNILSNAIQAIHGSGEIIISTEKLDRDFISVSIRDTGVGMSEDVVDKLFDPFFTTKDVSKGMGLGMSITYGIIKKHNGDVKVHSQVGAGTEFIITLPVYLVA